MKKFVREVGIGFLWFAGFTVATNLVVRPMLKKVATATNQPLIGNVL